MCMHEYDSHNYARVQLEYMLKFNTKIVYFVHLSRHIYIKPILHTIKGQQLINCDYLHNMIRYLIVMSWVLDRILG